MPSNSNTHASGHTFLSVGLTNSVLSTEGRRRRGREDKMVVWHHQLDGHEFEQALGFGEGQRSMACCSPWGHKELDLTE